MKQIKAMKDEVVQLTAHEVVQVSGGILEKEQLYPRKFGDSEYQVYVDGFLWGTIHA